MSENCEDTDSSSQKLSTTYKEEARIEDKQNNEVEYSARTKAKVLALSVVSVIKVLKGQRILLRVPNDLYITSHHE